MIKVSNSNANCKSKTAVRVYKDDFLVGEVFPTARNPLGYLKKYRRSKYNQQLIKQLKENGLSDAEIAEVYSD